MEENNSLQVSFRYTTFLIINLIMSNTIDVSNERISRSATRVYELACVCTSSECLTSSRRLVLLLSHPISQMIVIPLRAGVPTDRKLRWCYVSEERARAHPSRCGVWYGVRRWLVFWTRMGVNYEMAVAATATAKCENVSCLQLPFRRR